MKKKMLLLCVTILLLFSGVAIAGAGLSEKDELTIKKAGLSVYPGAVVLSGQRAMGIGFATSDDVEKVRRWYREKNPGWAVFDDGGMWVLYDGEPGLNPMEIMSKKQVLVNRNENLPVVHRMDKDITTEIAIIIPPAH